MTKRELAKLANVSPSTVTKAFSDADDVSEEMKQHIFKIAKQYGCYGKFYKGKYSKKIIAIICPELASNYYTGFVERLQKIIESNNGIPVISTDHFNSSMQAELIEYYASYLKVDGIIVFGLKNKLKKGYDTPIVSVFSTVDTSVDTVDVDFESAIFEAVKTLSEYGHKNIAFLGERLTYAKAIHFEQAMKNLGIDSPYTYESDYRFEEAGEDGVRHLLATKEECTAIICAYDNIAFGAIKELKRNGLCVPKDFSVIGIDNINTSKYMETALSSIGSNPDEICMIVWELLSKKMKNQFAHSNQQIVIRGNLIIRESVANPQKQELSQ